jgi:hypothetical protein
MGITTERTAHTSAYNALSTYLSPLLASLTTTTAITGATWRTNWAAYYTARQTVLNKIAAVAKTSADAAQAAANTAANAAGTAQTAADNAATAAGTAQTAANTANGLLADIASDNMLTPLEKSAAQLEWTSIVGSYGGIDGQAAGMGITTERTAHTSAYNALSTYLSPLLASLTTTTAITGATWRTNWAAYYTARQTVLNKIAATAATSATWSSVAGHPTDLNSLDATSGAKLVGIQAGATVGANSTNLLAGVGTNLLTNSELLANAQGWTFAATTAAISGTVASYSWTPPGRTCLIISQAARIGDTNQYGAWTSPRVSITAGERVEFSVWLGRDNASGYVDLTWYDAAGNPLASPNTSAGFSNDAGTISSALSTYHQCVQFAIAPAGTASCTMSILKIDSTSAGASTAVALMPYIGRALPAQTDATPYGPGPDTLGTLGYIGAINATYGATLGTNVSGQITPGNAGTLVAFGALDTSQLAGSATTERLVLFDATGINHSNIS